MIPHLFIANLKIFVRNRQAMFWSLAFPLVFVVAFGLFNFDEPTEITIAVVDQAQDPVSQRLIGQLGDISFLTLQTAEDEAAVRASIAAGDVGQGLIIPPGLAERAATGGGASVTLIQDQAEIQTNSIVRSVLTQVLDQINLALQDAQPLLTLDTQGISARQVDFFDFLLPGFVGMGVMFYGVIGMASVIALYREQKIFKRIKATPLKVRTFFTAQVMTYLVVSLVQASIILAVGVVFFGAHVYGNVLWMFPLVLLGNLSFLNLGFIVGSLARTVAAADGMANVVTMPMMFFSGVFFPVESLPTIIGAVTRYLPLSPLLDALRGVMLDARPLWDYPGEIGLLAAWVAVTAAIAIRVFRFE